MISLWTWNDSNGSATKHETMDAYSAITNCGQVSNFSYKVWNDLIDKINEIILNIKPEWISTYGNYLNTKMSESDKNLTANRFNAAVTNTYYMWWSWMTDSSSPAYTGRKEFHGVSRYGNSSDKVFGQYFIELADRMNTMIHIINDDEYAKDATVSLTDQISCLVECEALKVASFVVHEMQSCGAVPILSDIHSLSQETVGLLQLYFSAELELFDNRNGISAFIVDALNAIARARVLQPTAFGVEGVSVITANSSATTDEPSSMAFDDQMRIIGEFVLHTFGSDAMETVCANVVSNDSTANKFGSRSLNVETISKDVGEKTLTQSMSVAFGNNDNVNVLTNESVLTLINIYQAFMQASLTMIISELCELVKLLSEPFGVEDVFGAIASSVMEALNDPESINVAAVNVNTAVAVFELMGILHMVTNAVQTVSSVNNFELIDPLGLSGSAHADGYAGGSMELQYTKLVYATAVMTVILSMQDVLEQLQPLPMENDMGIAVVIGSVMEYLMSAVMTVLNPINLSLTAQANRMHVRGLTTTMPIHLATPNSMDTEMLKRFRMAIFANMLINAGFEIQRPYGVSAVANNVMANVSSLEIIDMFVRAFCHAVSYITSHSNLEYIDSVNGISATVASVLMTGLTGELSPSANLGNVNNNINLYIVPDLESKILAPMHVELAMVMACDANFDFEASWDYPDLIGNVLYVRQVKKMEQINKTLYLDANDNISELSMSMTVIPNLDGWHTIDGACRIISFHVGESGTLSLTTASAWIYPIHKENAELSVRQVYSATKTGETLEVS